MPSRRAGAGAHGLIDTLLTAEHPLTRQQLQDEAITLLTGAIETTGSTLAWTLYEVTRNPETERQLRTELASVCAPRPRGPRPSPLRPPRPAGEHPEVRPRVDGDQNRHPGLRPRRAPHTAGGRRHLEPLSASARPGVLP
ncbi:cytochrome P450 [Streptomyces sp. gb1(2016)]|uniref:Cytochrome P450 n=1 Tax=Streptomyces sp. gb1(2016) TaxID=1828321 RepID=A0A652LCR8_9ACTN|nr:cytochrome P450 [Streptomyces sp. gb1(2016)]